jgi:RimJ/RimL family protein N-acetyltransferase
MIDPQLFPVPAEIETPRLLLRSFRQSDAPELHEALVDSIAELRTHLWFLSWVSEKPTFESAEVRCRKAQAHFLLRTDLAYLALDKISGRLVASAGLHRTDWAVPKTEVGYWVRSGETGKGYATEAVNALTHWALTTLGAKRVELVTDELNTASRAVALRCGFRLEGILHHTMQGPGGELRNSCVFARLPNSVWAPVPASS